jgi:DNA-binding LacI/PurR family transcriptional regulator
MKCTKPESGVPDRLTMADLASELGIAKITVSRALSGHPAVRESTRQRIKEAADRLGYRLNISARNLRQQRSHTIAVVIEMTPSHDRSMSEPYPLSLLGGIMQELTAAGQNMVLTTIDLFSRAPPSVDGVILLGQGIHDDAAGVIERTGLPFVVWGATHGDDGTVVVGSDNHAGGRLAAERLLSLGRSRFVFLGETQHAEIGDRLNGFEAGLVNKAGAMIARIPCAFTVSGGRDAMTAFLGAGAQDFDGIFASSDAIAMGAIEALRVSGRRVPEDVSVIGFDDSPGAALFTPPLTSIRQDWQLGGSLLAQKVLQLATGEGTDSRALPVSLSIRES